MSEQYKTLVAAIGAWISLGFAAVSSQNAQAFEAFTAHGGPVKSVDVSANERLLASASFDYSVVLWLLPEFEDIQTLIGHEAAVNVAKFDPTGRWLATGGDDNLILLWDLEALDANPTNGQSAVLQPTTLRGHSGRIVDLNFSADGQSLVSASWDGTAKLWSLKRQETFGAEIGSLEAHDGPVNSAQFSNSGMHIYTAGYDGHIRYWRRSDQAYLRSIIQNGWGVNVMAVDEAHQLLAYGTANGAMVLYNLATKEPVLQTGDDGTPTLSVALTADHKQVAFGNSQGHVYLIDRKSRQVMRQFRAANGPVWSMQLISNGKDLVIAGLDDHIIRWGLNSTNDAVMGAASRRFHPLKEMSNGERQFARKCSVCHTLVEDGARRAGPSLYRLFGRRAGSLPNYPYSQALLESDIIWSAETVAQLFTKGPDVVTPGTKMPIQRLHNQQDRTDLIRFLKQATQGGSNTPDNK